MQQRLLKLELHKFSLRLRCYCFIHTNLIIGHSKTCESFRISIFPAQYTPNMTTFVHFFSYTCEINFCNVIRLKGAHSALAVDTCIWGTVFHFGSVKNYCFLLPNIEVLKMVTLFIIIGLFSDNLVLYYNKFEIHLIKTNKKTVQKTHTVVNIYQSSVMHILRYLILYYIISVWNWKQLVFPAQLTVHNQADQYNDNL